MVRTQRSSGVGTSVPSASGTRRNGAGVGVTLADESRSRAEIAAGELVAVLEEFSTPFPGFFLYYPERRHASPALRAFIDYLHRARGAARDEAWAKPLTRCAGRVPLPVVSGISKWVSRHTSQEVCPWNQRFAQESKEPAFRKSPMKRAKLAGLQRNAEVVLLNIEPVDHNR